MPLTLNNGLAEGQTLQDVTASRAANTTYTNTTGKAIIVIIQHSTQGLSQNHSVNYNGYGNMIFVYANTNQYASAVLTLIVKPGHTYSVTAFSKWYEIR